MKNKKLFGICSLLFATGLILGACGTKTNSSSQTSETSITSSSSSSEAVEKFTVRFLVEGQVVQTSEVEKGQLAHYDGETPTKAGDAQADKYGFRNWDKDLNTPITANTDFNAVFAAYANHQVIGDFESYTESAELIDDGWTVLGYNNTTKKWEVSESASLALAVRARNGQQSLRLNNWGNGVGHKIAKTYPQNGAFAKSANALKFSFMTPSYNVLKVLLHFNAELTPGTVTDVSFTYTINPISSEYVDYVLPFASEKWLAWGDAQYGTLQSLARSYGLHEDDLPTFISAVEFYVQGNDGTGGQPQISFLDSAEFVTLSEPKEEMEQHFEQFARYTGTLESGNVVRLDIQKDGETATFSAIDLETPIEVPGKVALDEATNTVSFVSSDSGETLNYSGTLMNGGQFVKFKSATGTMAAQLGELDLNAVQVLDNFEQYDKDGQAYCQKYSDKNARSGARGAYYSEYYSGSGSTEWGGAGWSLMGGEGDQLKLKTDGGGHNGSTKYLCMKNSATYGMRYMQWGMYDGSSEQQSYRGSKLSFWARTYGVVPQFIVSAYSQTAPKNATKDQQVKKLPVNSTAAISSWTHYEVELNPALVYYGFVIFMEKNGSADSYLYIDDVEVYTANPYAQYVAPVTAELQKGMTYNTAIGGGLVNANLEILADKAVKITIPGFGATINGTYSASESEITISANGDSYVATASKDLSTLTFKSVSGTGLLAQYFKNVSFGMVDYADNAETYEGQGKMYYKDNKDVNNISGARGAYHCDFYKEGNSNPSIIGGSNWSLMEGSGDQLQLDTSNSFDGSQSIKMRYSTAGNMRYLQWGLTDGSGKGHTKVNKLGLYVKNPNAVDVKFKVYAYYKAQVTPNDQGSNRAASDELTIAANSGWTLFTLGLDSSKTYYGYGIYMVTKSSAGFINIDKVFYFNDYASPEVNFVAKSGLALSGNITAGPATMTFGDNGAVTLNNEHLGGDLAGTYVMRMGETAQEMVITTAAGTITGTYAVNNTGVVTFTVTAVTGDLAGGVNVGAVLSNAH